MDRSLPADNENTLSHSLSLVNDIRTDNPNDEEFKKLNDQQLAELVHRETGDVRLLPAARSSAISRGIDQTSKVFGGIGQTLEDTIKGTDENPSFGRRLAGRVVNNTVAGAPELALLTATSRLPLAGKIAGVVAGSAFDYGKTINETGDEKAALGNAGGFALNALGGSLGSAKGRAMAGPDASWLKKAAMGSAGAAIGQLPGDYLSQATSPGEDLTLSKFRSDPVNLPAYALGQGVVGPAMDFASERREAGKARVEQQKRKTQDFSELVNKNDADEFSALSKKPIAERTEMDTQRMTELDARLKAQDEANLAKVQEQTSPTAVSNLAEVPATVKGQVELLNKQKKALVEIPAGQEPPPLDPWNQQAYHEHVGSNGNLYLYDEQRTNPAQIEDAIKGNGLGYLLGYGVGGLPAKPTGEMVVLRNRKGVELSSVVVDHESKPGVIDALKKMASAEDTVGVESPSSVLSWRLKNKDLLKLYSLETRQPDTKGEVHFTNTVLDMFQKSLTPKIKGYRSKGARFQVDSDGAINGAGLLKAVKDWAPAELWDHYKEQGIEQFLEPSKHVYTVQAPQEYEGRQIPGYKQIDPIKDNGRGEPLTKAEREALPQAPDDLPTGQYVRRGDKWLPVKDPTVVPTKVPAEAFADWLRKNTPQIEVKKLVPTKAHPDVQAYSEHIHMMDTKYPYWTEPARVKSDYQKDPAFNEAMKKYRELEEISDQVPKSDAATGRYNVDPIDVSEMDSPADILVRVPHNAKKLEHLTKNDVLNVSDHETNRASGVLFDGPHFGKSDKNVLASIRGYFKNLADGSRAFFPFEIQSDWGQQRNEILNRDDIGNMHKQHMLERTPDHPLLKSYETLAIKTAIQHARANGATKLILPDSKTAMMTEGHDRRQQNGQITQQKGMEAHYDGSLREIAERLTRSKGTPIDLGPFTTRGASYALGTPGKPKTNITGRVYDISNPSKEVTKLFSLYDAESQLSFKRNLEMMADAFNNGLRTSEELTPQQMLERAVQGDRRIETDALVKFLDSIKGERGVLREMDIPSDGKTQIVGMANVGDNSVTINKNAKLTLQKAQRTLAHEFTHVAIGDLKYTNPLAYKSLLGYAEDIGQKGRQSILDGLRNDTKIKDGFDTEYLSGKLFDPADPKLADKNAHEFAAGIIEAFAQHHFDNASNPSWLATLPQPIQMVVKKAVALFKKYFGNKYPSLYHELDEKQAKSFDGMVGLMEKHVVDAEQQNLRAYLKLKSSEAFDETQYIQNIPDQRAKYGKVLTNLASGDNALYSLFRDGAENTGLLDKARKFGEDNFLSALFRTRTKPFTSAFFWALHGLRPAIQSEQHGYQSFLGQLPDNSLSREQAYERWNKFIKDTLNPFKPNARRQFLDGFSRINEENQNRREATQNATDADLVSTQEMTEKYGLSPEQAEFSKRIIKMSELVAAENQRKAQAVDGLSVAKLFYRQNKDQDIAQVKDKVARLTRITNEAGPKRYEMELLQKQLEKLQAQDEPSLEQQGEIGARLQQLQAEEANFKLLMDQQIRGDFGANIPFQPGQDSFIGNVSELMVKLSALRAHQRAITKDAGYAPMTRRGRFLLRVWDNTELGQEFATVKEFKGFDSEKEARDYIAKNKLTDEQFELMDKNSFRDRARIYNPDKLKLIKDLAEKQLADTIQRLSQKTSDMDDATRQNVLDAYKEVQNNFKPLDDEIKDVLSVRGDKFKERRYLVPGFDRNDFLPNIFEYMNYKSVAGNKALARAEAELQMEHKQVDPELFERLGMEKEYVLGQQDEWQRAAKANFLYYLGGSVRHMAQNAVQMPMNGISQMVADGHGLKSYGYFARAAKLSAEYAHSGTTGDKIIDSMLKQAEKDGISMSTILEAPTHDSLDIQNAIDSMVASQNGSLRFGEKVSYTGTQVMKVMEKLLTSTSAAAEKANRQTTFIANVLAERAKGTRDLQTIYDKSGQFTNYVNFVGDKANRPGFIIKTGQNWTHAPLMLLTALQSFTINHISQLYSFAERGFKGGSANDRKALYTGIAHLLAFSGGMGFIGAATAEALFEDLTGFSIKTGIRKGLVQGLPSFTDDEEKKEKYKLAGDRIADGVLYGLPGLVGVDASQNVGLGAPFLRYQAGKELALKDAMGPTAGLLGKLGEGAATVGADPFNPQQYWAATKSAAPTFLSQFLKMQDVLNSGATVDKNQQPVSDPLGVAGSVGASLGFSPVQTTKQREFNSQQYKIKKTMGDEYERNTRNIAQLLNDYKQSGDPELLLNANNQLAKYVDSVGQLQDRDAMVNSVTQQYEQFQGRVTTPATRKELPALQSLEGAFPSVKPRYPSEISTALDEIEVAQLLGQGDVLVRKLQSLPRGVLDKALTDELVARGVPPALISQFLRPGSEAHLGPSR